MADSEHLKILRAGRKAWHEWRAGQPSHAPNLDGLQARNGDFSWINFENASLQRADLMRSKLGKAVLRKSNCNRALFNECDMREVDLSSSSLVDTNFAGADLRQAVLSGSNARNADFTNADLSGADLSGCNLTSASLIGARLVRTNLSGATIDGCYVFGCSTWDINLEGSQQRDLMICPYHEHSPDNPYEAERIPTHLSQDRASDRTEHAQTTITVDRLDVASFIYLLLNNKSLRDVIDTVASRAVLILGRFSPAHKPTLERLREHLRTKHYLPIVFDFDGPHSRNTTETVATLAHLSCFVVADLTDPKSVPHELMRFAPMLPSVPVQPIITAGQAPYSMFEDFLRYPWVLPPVEYGKELAEQSAAFSAAIMHAEAKVAEFARAAQPGGQPDLAQEAAQGRLP